MKEILRRHRVSFQNAFAGLIWSFKTQPNFRIHFTLAFLAVMAGYFFRIKNTEWVVIVFTIVLALSAEMINTALEAMTDLITSEWRENAKIAKDVAAGMMLTVAIGSLFVATLVYLPYIKDLF